MHLPAQTIPVKYPLSQNSFLRRHRSLERITPEFITFIAQNGVLPIKDHPRSLAPLFYNLVKIDLLQKNWTRYPYLTERALDAIDPIDSGLVGKAIERIVRDIQSKHFTSESKQQLINHLGYLTQNPSPKLHKKLSKKEKILTTEALRAQVSALETKAFKDLLGLDEDWKAVGTSHDPRISLKKTKPYKQEHLFSNPIRPYNYTLEQITPNFISFISKKGVHGIKENLGLLAPLLYNLVKIDLLQKNWRHYPTLTHRIWDLANRINPVLLEKAIKRIVKDIDSEFFTAESKQHLINHLGYLTQAPSPKLHKKELTIQALRAQVGPLETKAFKDLLGLDADWNAACLPPDPKIIIKKAGKAGALKRSSYPRKSEAYVSRYPLTMVQEQRYGT